MNIHEALKTISTYIDMLHNQGVLYDYEIEELSDAEQALYDYINAMEGEKI